MDFIWDIYQQGRISEAHERIDRAQEDARSSEARIRDLEFALHRSSLASQAMWELLRSRFNLTEAELLAKVEEVDLRDGKRDHRMAPQLSSCSACNRKLNTKNPRCIYCGADVLRPHAFQ